MDFAERLKRHADRLRAMRPARLAPTASIRIDLAAGPWSEGEPVERLARLCAACCEALRAEPLPAGAYDGHKGLSVDPGAGLSVGLDGGRVWARIAMDRQDGAAMAARLHQAAQRPTDARAGLELVDLSSLGVIDWRGTLARPQLARLVLLAPEWLPARPGADTGARPVLGLAMDYDQRILDAARAASFLALIDRGLREGVG